ncbi:MAG TPA: tRNA (adenosine(37)-N6)-dimethylallyltransferase MiaA, partial [Gammaproteobacteria bacterium]|nr:tRNA (adenosine(37)-N6)-dimethylallyltransferase MiaA [Gammaproteobacteria bacterium]
FDQMLAGGLLEEVSRLYRRGDLSIDLPAMRAVGYRQVWNYLAGNSSYEQMRDHAVTATRQFAKRQLTWLRAESEADWFDNSVSDSIGRIIRHLGSIFV